MSAPDDTPMAVQHTTYLGITDTRPVEETQKVEEGEPGDKIPVQFSEQLALIDPANVDVRVVQRRFALVGHGSPLRRRILD